MLCASGKIDVQLRITPARGPSEWLVRADWPAFGRNYELRMKNGNVGKTGESGKVGHERMT
jgi:hypothetical protein